MSMTGKDFWSELQNYVPKLGPFLAKREVNRAWRIIQDSREWSFLRASGHLYSPPVITSGLFSVTQFSNIVTANATAITALGIVNNPFLTKRQIRFGSGPPTTTYNISVVDPNFAANGILYLDEPYREATSSAIGYRVYRCYYGPPEISTVDSLGGIVTQEDSRFLRWESLYNPQNSRWFILPVLADAILNRRDPRRSVTGNIPYWMFSYKTVNSLPYYEMWPHPLQAGSYPATYIRIGTDLADTDTLPAIIPDDLLMEASLARACGWAAANTGRFPELKGANWRLEAEAHKRLYSNVSSQNPGLLEIAHRNDEELYPQSQVIDSRSYNVFPLGDDDLMTYGNITP